MNRRITQMKVAAGLAMVGVGVALATESLGSPPTMTEAAELDKLAGQGVRAVNCLGVRHRRGRGPTPPP